MPHGLYVLFYDNPLNRTEEDGLFELRHDSIGLCLSCMWGWMCSLITAICCREKRNKVFRILVAGERPSSLAEIPRGKKTSAG